MNDLSEGARDGLRNADSHTGAPTGALPEPVTAELRAAGLISPAGNLTRAGAERARRVQADARVPARPRADDADGLPIAWCEQARQLGEEARDGLLNADRHTGGAIGIGLSDDSVAELQAAGLVSQRWNLTRAGAELARHMQDAYWPEF